MYDFPCATMRVPHMWGMARDPKASLGRRGAHGAGLRGGCSGRCRWPRWSRCAAAWRHRVHWGDPQSECMASHACPCVPHAYGAWQGTPEALWVGGGRTGLASWGCSGRCRWPRWSRCAGGARHFFRFRAVRNRSYRSGDGQLRVALISPAPGLKGPSKNRQ